MVTNPAKEFGTFASTSNVRAQKGYLIAFSLTALILFYGGLFNKINKELFETDTLDNSVAIQVTHYIMLYMILHYSINYFIEILTIRHPRTIVVTSLLTILTGGLYLTVLFVMDFLLPVGFAVFTFYKMNQICNCIMNNNEIALHEISEFYRWGISYISAVWASIYTFAGEIYGRFDWIRDWYKEIAGPMSELIYYVIAKLFGWIYWLFEWLAGGARGLGFDGFEYTQTLESPTAPTPAPSPPAPEAPDSSWWRDMFGWVTSTLKDLQFGIAPQASLKWVYIILLIFIAVDLFLICFHNWRIISARLIPRYNADKR